MINPEEHTSQFSIIEYQKAVIRGFSSLRYSYFILYLFFSVILFKLYLKNDSIRRLKYDFDAVILLALNLSMLLHYLVYPTFDDRLYLTHYLIISILLVKVLLNNNYEFIKNK